MLKAFWKLFGYVDEENFLVKPRNKNFKPILNKDFKPILSDELRCSFKPHDKNEEELFLSGLDLDPDDIPQPLKTMNRERRSDRFNFRSLKMAADLNDYSLQEYFRSLKMAADLNDYSLQEYALSTFKPSRLDILSKIEQDTTSDSDFLLAVSKDDINTVSSILQTSSLLERQTLLKTQNSMKEHALQIAARSGFLEMTRLLTKYGADPDVQDGTSWPVLLNAARLQNNPEIIEALMAARASVDIAHRKGWTALMCAAEKAHVGVMKVLLKHQADVHKKDLTGKTAMDYVLPTGHYQAFDLLRKAGAHFDKTKMQPMMKAQYELISLMEKQMEELKLTGFLEPQHGEEKLLAMTEAKDKATMEAIYRDWCDDVFQMLERSRIKDQNEGELKVVHTSERLAPIYDNLCKQSAARYKTTPEHQLNTRARW